MPTTEQHYPRGTPRLALGAGPRTAILSLLVLVSTAVASAVVAPSFQEISVFDAVLAAVGAIACLAGLIYDFTMYALALEVVVRTAVL
jgi:hypothetical protein